MSNYVEPMTNIYSKGAMTSICVLGEPIPPTELRKFRVIITSYHFLSAEIGRVRKFEDAMKEYKRERSTRLPRKPTITFLTGLWEQPGVRSFVPYLVLDKAHLTNTFGRTYYAIESVRSYFEACMMMTGIPLDNTSQDSFALLSLLKGRVINTRTRVRLTSASQLSTVSKHRRVYLKGNSSHGSCRC